MTSPGVIPVDLHIAKMVMRRGKDGVYHITGKCEIIGLVLFYYNLFNDYKIESICFKLMERRTIEVIER